MAGVYEAVRMSLVPEEIKTVEDRIDYLSKSLDELRASSATKGISRWRGGSVTCTRGRVP
ncbi:hypothetical protein EJB05_33356, partial [Eragrostis curvula]